MLDEDIKEYAAAIVSGIGAGLSDILHGITHPEEFLISMSKLTYDGLVITAFNNPEMGVFSEEDPDFQFFKKKLEEHPSYIDSLTHMRQRIDGINALGKEFADGSLDKKIHMFFRMGTNVLAPGYFLKGIQAASNVGKFGMPYNPPLFRQYSFDFIPPPTLPLKILSVNEIRKQQAPKDFIYVVTKKGNLLLADDMLPKHLSKELEELVVSPYAAHSDFGLDKVVVAGYLEVKGGSITKIDNFSGECYSSHDYTLWGKQLDDVVKKVFSNHGYKEVLDEDFIFQHAGRASFDKDGRVYMTHEKLGVFPRFPDMLFGGTNYMYQASENNQGSVAFAMENQEAPEDEQTELEKNHAEDQNEEKNNTQDRLKKFAEANSLKLDALEKELENLSTEQKEEFNRVLEILEEQENRRNFDEKIKAAKTAFNDISTLGASTRSETLLKAGVIGSNMVTIAESLHTLQRDFPALQGLFSSTGPLGAALSGLAFVQPYLSLATAAFQIGMVLFSKPKEDLFAKEVLTQLHRILESLHIIRLEMHALFERTERNILNKIDTVYFALSHLIKANHRFQAENMNYGFSQLEEDIQHMEKTLRTLIKAPHLDNLSKVMLDIDAHKQGEIVPANDQDKLNHLKERERDLLHLWLLKNLVSHSYNGGIYSTDSTRQDFHFVGEGTLYPEYALGFLYQFARDKLDLAPLLSDVKGNLPAVDLWTQAIPSFIGARLYAAQAYGAPLQDNKVEELKEIALNTLAFVDKLSLNAEPLFQQITKNYASSMQKLKEEFIKTLTQVIKDSDREYTLKECLEKGWIDLKISPNVGQEFVDKARQHPDAERIKISLLTLLAIKFGMGSFHVDYTIGKTDAYAGWDTSVGHVDGTTAVYARTGSATVQLKIKLLLENNQYTMLEINAHRGTEVIYRYRPCSDYYEGTVATGLEIARKATNKKSDSEWIAQSSISGIGENPHAETVIKDMLSHDLAHKIIDILMLETKPKNQELALLAPLIKDKDKEYTLKECLEKSWININLKIPQRVKEDVVYGMMRHWDAKKVKIPVLLLLASKMEIGSFQLDYTLEKTAASAERAETDEEKKFASGREGVIVKSGGVAVKFTLKFLFKGKEEYRILEVNAGRKATVIHRYEVDRTWLLETLLREKRKLRDLPESITDSEWITKSSIYSIEEQADVKTLMEYSPFLDSVNQLIEEKSLEIQAEKQSLNFILGDELAIAGAILFEEGINKVRLNKVDTDPIYQLIPIMHSVALAYADLIGLPKDSINKISEIMVYELNFILRNPYVFAQAEVNMGELQKLVATVLPVRHSRVFQKMSGSIKLLNEFLAISALYQSYQKNLSHWEEECNTLSQLQQQLTLMLAINERNSQYFTKELLEKKFSEIRVLDSRLYSIYIGLLISRKQLQELGFTLPLPEKEEFLVTSETHEPSLRRGTVRDLTELQGKSLIEIIESSDNPYEEVSRLLSSFEIEKAMTYVQASNESGQTALHVAAKINDLPLIELLVNFDALIDKEDHQQKKAIDYLSSKNQKARVFLRSREKWQDEAQDLSISMPRIAYVLEEIFKHLKKSPSCENAAAYWVGRTGGTKSTNVNYANGSEYIYDYDDETGERRVELSNNVEEIAETGSSSVSVTQFPGIYNIREYTHIDMPGFEDSSGKEEEIKAGILIDLAAKKCPLTKVIHVVLPEEDVFDVRKTELRKTLRKIGLMIQADPENLSKHFLFVITKPSKDKLDNINNDYSRYEHNIYNLLYNWLIKEIQNLRETHVDYPIKHVLEQLRENQIILMDVTQPQSRQRYQERLKLLPPAIESKRFNFQTYDASTEEFKRFVRKIDTYYQHLQEDIKHTLAALCNHWKETHASHHIFNASQFQEVAHHPLIKNMIELEVHQTINNEWIQYVINVLDNQTQVYANTTQGVVGNVKEITEQLVELMEELVLIQPFLHQLGQLAISLGLNVSENLKQAFVEKAPSTAQTTSPNPEELNSNTCTEETYNTFYKADSEDSAWPFPAAKAGEEIILPTISNQKLTESLTISAQHVVQAEREPHKIDHYIENQNNNHFDNSSNILFDHGKWDSVIETHPKTGEPVFTFRAYFEGKEVGNLRLYKHPLLCRSEDGSRHNILSATGIFSQVNLDASSLEEVCATLPPTLFDEVVTSAKHGAGHGALRGATRVVGYTLKMKEFSPLINRIIQNTVYYGGYFLFRYQIHASQQPEESGFSPFFQAVIDTGSVFMLSAYCDWFRKETFSAGTDMIREGWTKWGYAIQFFGKANDYILYACDAAKQGVSSVASSIAAGKTTEILVEKVGKEIVDNVMKPR